MLNKYVHPPKRYLNQAVSLGCFMFYNAGYERTKIHITSEN